VWLILMNSSSIIKDIESICATRLASATYYYFNFKGTEKQDRQCLLTSLLIQLCTQSHRGYAYDILLILYKASEGSRQPAVTRGDCPDPMSKRRPRTPWSWQSLHHRLIVDAVDESPISLEFPLPVKSPPARQRAS
jgi:hypothetical protein